MDVLDALDATAHLAELGQGEPTTVDELLRALGLVPGVDRSTIMCPTADVRPGRHGVAQVRWTQDGRQRTAEGHTLHVASRRALRDAERVSAKAGPK